MRVAKLAPLVFFLVAVSAVPESLIFGDSTEIIRPFTGCSGNPAQVLDWKGLSPGPFATYGGFRFSGFSSNSTWEGGKPDVKCISAAAFKRSRRSSDRAPAVPSFQIGAGKDAFLINHLLLSMPADIDVDLTYALVDGSTCRHTITGSSSGTTVSENPCGSATSVQFELPADSEYDHCDFCIYSVGFACLLEPAGQASIMPLKARALRTDRGQSKAKRQSASSIPGFSIVQVPTRSFQQAHSSSLSRVVSLNSPRSPSQPAAWTSPSPLWATSTVYTTSELTIISCAPTVTNCPADSTIVHTSTTAISTIVSPVASTWIESKVTHTSSRSVSTVSHNTVPASSWPSWSTRVTSTPENSRGPGMSTTAPMPAQWTTSTIYTTSEITVISCAATVTNCPADSSKVVTSTIAISTTVCPVNQVSTASSTSGSPSGFSRATQPASSGFVPTTSLASYTPSSRTHTAEPSTSASWITSTLYMTSEVTVISCAPTVTNCPADSTNVVTSTIAISTTVRPITETTSRKSVSTGARSTQPKLTTIDSTRIDTQTGGSPSSPSISSSNAAATTSSLSLTEPTQSSTDTSSQWTTSTIFTTREITITSCAPTVTNCPADSTNVITSTIAVSTTICPVTETSFTATRSVTAESTLSPTKTGASASGSSVRSSNVAAPSGTQSLTRPLQLSTDTVNQWTTSTVFTTREITVTSCAPTVTNCPADSTSTFTSTIAISTTVCPVTETTSAPSAQSTSTGISTAVSVPISTGSSGPLSTTSGLLTSPSHVITRPSTLSLTEPTTSTQTVSQWSTSTVYTTSEITITSCAPTVTNCPADSTQVVTSTIAISTTVCPVTETTPRSSQSATSSSVPNTDTATTSESGSPSAVPSSRVSSVTSSSSVASISETTKSATDKLSQLTSVTVYTTRETTAVSCAATMTGCLVNSTQVITSTVIGSTTQHSDGASASLPTVSKISTTGTLTSSSPSLVYTQSTAPVWTSSTGMIAYTTRVQTLTSCAGGSTSCPTGFTQVVTSTIILSTSEVSTSGSFSQDTESTTATVTSSRSHYTDSSTPQVQTGYTSLTAPPASTPSQCSPSDIAVVLPTSTLTLVAYTTTTMCSATATVLVESPESLKFSSQSSVFDVTPGTLISSEHSVSSTTIAHHTLQTMETMLDSVAYASPIASHPTDASLTSPLANPSSNHSGSTNAASDEAIWTESRWSSLSTTLDATATAGSVSVAILPTSGPMTPSLVETPTECAASLSARPTDDVSSLALQCIENSLWLAPECASSNDIACTCASAKFETAVLSCIVTHGSSQDGSQTAIAALTGICGQWAFKNPESLPLMPATFTATPTMVVSFSVPDSTTAYPTVTVSTAQGTAAASRMQIPVANNLKWPGASGTWASTAAVSSSSTEFSSPSSRLHSTTSSLYRLTGSASSSLGDTSTSSASNRSTRYISLFGSFSIFLWFMI